MQCKTNYVSKVNSVAAILYLQFTTHVMSFLMLYVLYPKLVLSEALRSAQCGFF
jgi:hypothetical protein